MIKLPVFFFVFFSPALLCDSRFSSVVCMQENILTRNVIFVLNLVLYCLHMGFSLESILTFSSAAASISVLDHSALMMALILFHHIQLFPIGI